MAKLDISAVREFSYNLFPLFATVVCTPNILLIFDSTEYSKFIALYWIVASTFDKLIYWFTMI